MKIKLKPPYDKSCEDSYKSWGLNCNSSYNVLRIDKNIYTIENDIGTQVMILEDLIEKNMTPTKEQVLEAASTSKEARNALVKLFPKYFEDEKYVDIEDNVMYKYMCRRDGGKYAGKGFYLIPEYNWEIFVEENGVQTLIPTKRYV